MKDIPFTVELPLEEPPESPPAEPDPGQQGKVGRTKGAKRLPKGASHGPKAKGEPPVLSVGQLTRHIRGLLEESFATVLVEGELSNVKRAASGHIYFSLKDAAAQVRCVMFRNAAVSLRFQPEEGLQVLVRGRISVYDARGEYQIQVLTLEPRGAGALQLAFEQLKQRLDAEGLFDPARKRELPYLPRRIGIVTSPQGAAVKDMLTVLARRFPTLPVLIYPALVQGEQAAPQIAQGIAELNRLAARQHIDVIIVGRGGGSVEDLWAFNEEVVARAIHASQVPVISAVGHEVDFTIADFVADVRAPTPSAAAELAVPPRDALRADVAELRQRLFDTSQRRLALAAERVSGLRARLTSPEAALRQHALRLDDLGERLLAAGQGGVRQAAQRVEMQSERLALLRPDRFHALHRKAVAELERRLAPAVRRLLARQHTALDGQMELLDSLSPLTVMGRGYTAARHASGEPLRSVGEVEIGAELRLRLRDGELDATVLRTRHVQARPGQPVSPGGPVPSGGPVRDES